MPLLPSSTILLKKPQLPVRVPAAANPLTLVLTSPRDEVAIGKIGLWAVTGDNRNLG